APRAGAPPHSSQLSLWDDFRSAPAHPAPGDGSRSSAPPTTVHHHPAAAHPDGAHHGLDELFARVHRRLGFRPPAPLFRVAFRRFTGLRSTIRSRNQELIEAYLSDLLEDASPVVLEAIAEILITRLFRVATSREADECYQAWAHSPAVAHRIEEVRRQRGRKILRAPQGNYFNLHSIFDDLNRRFFGGELGQVRIGWSPVRSRTMLGHYDASHCTITITRWLDARRVPRYVVEYLVYHEMLHARFPVERRAHRRVVHTRAFREAERKFPHYTRAVHWLKTGCTRGAGPPETLRRALDAI
ncbi:MAG TPA: SprT-like domain-containing protein, partial [Terriglobia bacterium]|nr:SprT-like domain-containing protein [Terriglobia bacterium]